MKADRYSRMVGLLKTALKATMTPGLHTEEEFITATVLAREFVNRRPLAYVSSDAGDGKVLTPNSFLHTGKHTPDFHDHGRVRISTCLARLLVKNVSISPCGPNSLAKSPIATSAPDRRLNG